MKKVVFLVVSILFISANILFAQSKTEKFMVKGNCSMCEDRIENAALSVNGVSMAEWCMKSKMLKVTFDESKTNIKTIHKAIAKAGHDTKMYKANNKTYEELPACCKYREKKANTKCGKGKKCKC